MIPTHAVRTLEAACSTCGPGEVDHGELVRRLKAAAPTAPGALDPQLADQAAPARAASVSAATPHAPFSLVRRDVFGPRVFGKHDAGCSLRMRGRRGAAMHATRPLQDCECLRSAHTADDACGSALLTLHPRASGQEVAKLAAASLATESLAAVRKDKVRQNLPSTHVVPPNNQSRVNVK